MCAEEGISAAHLNEAEVDFDAFVRTRRQVRQLWGVPVTELWFVEGDQYIGTVVFRHELTEELVESGGHLGYHVVPRLRRRGHGTRMLAAAISFCAGRGVTELLITCDEDNLASRRMIEVNGGLLEGVARGEARYWIRTTAPRGRHAVSPAAQRSTNRSELSL
jgi:predicted acetyltransferase